MVFGLVMALELKMMVAKFQILMLLIANAESSPLF
jgi:hypothetical protein